MKKLIVFLFAMFCTVPAFAVDNTPATEEGLKQGITGTFLAVNASRHPLIASVALTYAMFSHDPITADCPVELFNAPLVKVANADNPNGYSFYKTACEVKRHPDKYVLK